MLDSGVKHGGIVAKDIATQIYSDVRESVIVNVAGGLTNMAVRSVGRAYDWFNQHAVPEQLIQEEIALESEALIDEAWLLAHGLL